MNGIITRTWDYGTKLPAKVIDANENLLVVESSGEGFILLGQKINPIPPIGTMGHIVFRQGGPTGGYWQWLPNSA